MTEQLFKAKNAMYGEVLRIIEIVNPEKLSSWLLGAVEKPVSIHFHSKFDRSSFTVYRKKMKRFISETDMTDMGNQIAFEVVFCPCLKIEHRMECLKCGYPYSEAAIPDNDPPIDCWDLKTIKEKEKKYVNC